jgi:hypothetical protein
VPQKFIDMAREEARKKKERAALLMRPHETAGRRA